LLNETFEEMSQTKNYSGVMLGICQL